MFVFCAAFSDADGKSLTELGIAYFVSNGIVCEDVPAEIVEFVTHVTKLTVDAMCTLLPKTKQESLNAHLAKRSGLPMLAFCNYYDAGKHA